MKIFLSNIEENALYQKVLTIMSRGDILYLLHPDNRDNIPLSIVNYFQQTKGTVQFLAYDHNNSDLNKVYIYGRLMFQYEVINLVTNDTALKIAATFSDDAIRPNDINEVQEEIEEKAETPAVETKQPVKRVVVVKKETSVQSTEQPVEINSDSVLKPSKELTDLCTKLSSNEILLSDYIPQIIKSVESAINDSESFSSSLMKYCKNDIAEKIEDAFCGYETELFAIIENMKEKA